MNPKPHQDPKTWELVFSSGKTVMIDQEWAPTHLVLGGDPEAVRGLSWAPTAPSHITVTPHEPSTREASGPICGAMSTKTLAAHPLCISHWLWLRAGFYSYFIFLFLWVFLVLLNKRSRGRGGLWSLRLRGSHRASSPSVQGALRGRLEVEAGVGRPAGSAWRGQRAGPVIDLLG